MKRGVDVLYTLRKQPVVDRFTDFKKDFFTYGDTPPVAVNVASARTTGFAVTAQQSIGFSVEAATLVGVSLSSTATTGISITGATTTAAIDITSCTGRAIRVGTKGTTYNNSGSIAISSTGANLDTDPANNYLVGVFSKVAVSETTLSKDDLGSAWFRTRVDAGVAIGAGYSLYGVKSQLRIYGGSSTSISNWAAAGLLGVLEVSGASTTFVSGCIAAAVYANVSLTSDATIASGAVVAGLVAISASATITDTGAAYYGVYVGKSGAVAFDAGLKVASSSCTVGVDIGTCTTGMTIGTATSGISITGTVTQALNLTAVANLTYVIKFNTIAGCVIAKDADPLDTPSGGGLGADGVITILINTTPYYIPYFGAHK
jgi:hypothetical protein